jgi:predicted dehydrogenase
MSIRVALVGLGFGAEFTPIYLHHPEVSALTICDANEEKLNAHGDRYEVADRCLSLDDILERDDIDAVHLVSPIPLHAEQAVAVLQAGKHCACTVPMALSLDDLRAIIAAQRASGKHYMMMETAVYCREFLFAQELVAGGELGKLQFLRGAHYQDMEAWPPYWLGLPPMWYATHAIAPLLRLADARAERVHCFGSGTMREELVPQYGNPYPVETALFQLAGSEVAAEVTRTLFHVGREYQESFNVYAEEGVFEWGQTRADHPAIFRMSSVAEALARHGARRVTAERIEPPDYAHLLPEPLQRFTRRGVYDASRPHLSFEQGGGHGGSHPHLVHEFVSSIVEDRPPSVDAVTAANWTAAGLCAHESAMRGGEAVEVPWFGDCP